MTVTSISPDSRVADLAVLNPDITRVFESLGIDYCCGGRKTLQQASQAAGLSVDSILVTIDGLLQKPAESTDWSKATLTQLIAHILDAHHVYIRQEGPRLELLLNKVVDRHGGPEHPELLQLRDVFAGLIQELEFHMLKEEQILFPLVRRLEEDGDVPAAISCPVQRMMVEHDDAGEALATIRRLTSNFTPPNEACTSYQVLFQGLEAWEKDLHQHIHLENNILFPKALALQDAGMSSVR
jgi:regulator of cell morphogenesis and NO signaling